MSNIQKYLDELLKNKQRAEIEYQRVTELADLYPDLDIHTRLHGLKYMSKSINGTTEHYLLQMPIIGTDLLFCAYVEILNGIKVYANPAEIRIGKKDKYMSKNAVLDNLWKERLREHNINPILIERLEIEFKDNTALEYEEDEDD